MTSLARQLQRLAVPHTQTALSQDKRRASLLFDPREAASLDREAVFALGMPENQFIALFSVLFVGEILMLCCHVSGITGLEHLESLSPVFEEYETSIFNKTSQTFERSMQSKEVNAELDRTLRRFFIQLSPYILLKSAHKALEWLIYR